MRSGGGGSGPWGAGLMGSENVAWPALAGAGEARPPSAGVFNSTLGTELVVATRGPNPGCANGPPARPAPPSPDPFLVGDRFGALPDWSRGVTIVPKMGISPDVGVCRAPSVMGESLFGRIRSCVVGESWGARCDLRLSRSIKPQAHSLRSTGVRLAACTKASRSWQNVR